ncbi:hypothetical protein BaRGS_00002857 [Batillaria attramentaria]|uniref:Uncharacterized protein n=1 Tax=Batillaria attramentaria TaxID=370345 RepID=A0ABD0M2K0_9CAEN
MGGVVFQALEAPYEMNVKHQITEKRGQLVDKIHSLATGYSLNEVSRDNLTTELEKLLVDYQQYIHTETKDSGWDGKELDPDGDPDQEEYTQWSFASALLYAITVMTTIGE